MYRNPVTAAEEEFVDVLFDFIIVAANLARKVSRTNRRTEGVKTIENGRNSETTDTTA